MGRTYAIRESGGFWGFISFLTSSAIVLAAIALVAIFAFIAEVNRPGPSGQGLNINIDHGSSVTAIGQALERRGQIRNTLVFRIAAQWGYARGRGLQAGEYQIAPHASVRQIVQMMADGRAVQHAVTIPEGLTTRAVMEVIAASTVLEGPMPEAPAEGAILPETYQVTRGMTREALVAQMRQARDGVLANAWAHRADNLPISTPEEAMILASIVERETGVDGERPRVAAVFINRLRRHMALQSDPTIIYGVCKRYPARCKNGRLVDEHTGQPRVIRQSEIDMDTGYNTYRISGLPPTPIANPGRAAIEAVLNPAQTDDLYFVADGTGGHVFAATVEEHNANVARWRLIERQRLAQEAANRRRR
ncbi:MAG TPA: endolytic transglycosylase MltG [Caulobacterales bacterium]|nr:endolytic transglycosylase MltG [Caulobacterales bacterium]